MTVKELISKLRGASYLVELREDNFFSLQNIYG